MGEERRKKGWKKLEEVGEKPWGGFALLTVGQVCEVWSAYKTGRVSWLALRVFFAAVELSKTRCGVGKGGWVRFQRSELYPLIGNQSRCKVDAAVLELRNAGLTSFSSAELRFTRNYGDAALAMVAELGRHMNSQIPVPRFIAKRIARHCRPPEAGTILGLLTRCSFRKRRDNGEGAKPWHCVTAGACSARLVADVFGLNKTSVQNARKRLRTEGWVGFDDEQPVWHEKRFGKWTVLRLDWGKPAVVSSATGTVTREIRAEPERHIQESSSSKNNYQNPREAREPGFEKKASDERRANRNDMTCEALRNNELALELFAQCVARGEIGGSDADRLDFFSMIELSLAKGKDPVRYFVALLKRRRSELARHGHLKMDVATEAAEDRARERLKTLVKRPGEGRAYEELFGKPEKREPFPYLSRAEFMKLGLLERKQYELEKMRYERGIAA